MKAISGPDIPNLQSPAPSSSEPISPDLHSPAPSSSEPISPDLHSPDPHSPEAQSSRNISEAQRELADMIRECILSNPDRHITITELSETLHASPTRIKACFRKVYGVPIYTYGRLCRMKAAADLLRDTELSVLEIAGRCGYENGSKFSAAFRKVTGETPTRYRRRLRDPVT